MRSSRPGMGWRRRAETERPAVRGRACAFYNRRCMLALAGSSLPWQSAWLVVAAFLAGVLNAVARAGSFLVLRVVGRRGILPVPATATNTVALWPGQLTSIYAY